MTAIVTATTAATSTLAPLRIARHSRTFDMTWLPVTPESGRPASSTPSLTSEPLAGVINYGEEGSFTVTHGRPAMQVRPYESPDGTDSQADSTGSVPVTRSDLASCCSGHRQRRPPKQEIAGYSCAAAATSELSRSLIKAAAPAPPQARHQRPASGLDGPGRARAGPHAHVNADQLRSSVIRPGLAGAAGQRAGARCRTGRRPSCGWAAGAS